MDSAAEDKLAIRNTPDTLKKGERPIEQQGTKTRDLLAPAGTLYLGYIDNDQTVVIKH